MFTIFKIFYLFCDFALLHCDVESRIAHADHADHAVLISLGLLVRMRVQDAALKLVLTGPFWWHVWRRMVAGTDESAVEGLFVNVVVAARTELS